MSWLKPATGPIGAPFGQDRGPQHTPRYHQGVDIAVDVGTPVHASAAGIVTVAGISGLFGALGVIDHGHGHSTYCAHLSQIDVKVGQQVAAGQRIGLSGGMPGHWGAGSSTGPHCHHEHRILGKPFDPVPFWTTITPAGTGTPLTEQEDDMGRLVHHPNGTIALAGTDGSFVVLTTMDEVAALRATGAVGAASTDVHLVDDFIWRLRTNIAARKAAQ